MQNTFTLKKTGIPNGWKQLHFGDVFEFIQSLALSREQLTFDEYEGEILNIHYGDIHATYKTDLLDFNKEKRIPRIKNIVESKSLMFLKEGDLVIADASEDYKGVAANLEVKNIKSKKVTGGLHTFVARDISGFTVEGFRTYVLKNPLVAIELKKLATGSKVYGISKTNLATLEILLPPIKEQFKIAQILSIWDVAIETLNKIITKKERYKTTLMQSLFSGRLRFSEFKNSKWQKQTVQNLLDEGYLLDHLDGNHGGLYPKAVEFIKEGIPYIAANNFSNGRVDFNLCKYLSKERAGKFKKGISRNGDVLFAHNATVGPVALLETDLEYVILSTTATYFRCNNKKLLNKFLFQFLQSDYFVQQYKAVMGQSTRNQVPITTQKKFTVLFPEIKEQSKIASVLNAVDKEIQILKTQLVTYQKQKQGLMQVLLTGKKRVKI